MACAQPLLIPNPRYKDKFWHFHKSYWKSYIEIPCGWCLNCRVDKRNFLEDCCDFLQAKYGYCAFVTFTYDDNWLLERCNPYKVPVSCDSQKKLFWLEKYRNSMELLRIRHQSMFSLNRDDVRLLNYRLRSCIRNLPDSPITNHNYKVLYCGEYGGRFQRPHIHALFFGIDYTSPVFQKCWKYGYVESLPVKNGAFRYVVDYLDSEVHGKLAEELFDDCNLERPFMCKSVNFCTDFVLAHLDEARINNGSYKISPYKSRPLPLYFKKKFHVSSDPNVSLWNQLKNFNRKYGTHFHNIEDESFKTFARDMSILRFNHLSNLNRRKQIPVNDLEELHNFHYYARDDCIDWDVINDTLSYVPPPNPINYTDWRFVEGSNGELEFRWKALIYDDKYKDVIPF